MLYPKHKWGHFSTTLCAEFTAVIDCSKSTGDMPIYYVSNEFHREKEKWPWWNNSNKTVKPWNPILYCEQVLHQVTKSVFFFCKIFPEIIWESCFPESKSFIQHCCQFSLRARFWTWLNNRISYCSAKYCHFCLC